MTGRQSIASSYTHVVAKVMISLPEELLARIDREAKRRATTRSGLLQMAALRELGGPDPLTLDAAVARAQAAAATLKAGESADLVRADRDAR